MLEISDDHTGNILVLTVGLPRSGKSTWAQSKTYPVVSPDAIRLALYGSAFIADAEVMVWTLAKYFVRSLFIAGHKCVILDATSTTRARRDEWKSTRWKRRYQIMKASKEVCLERAKDSPQLIPVIERMSAQFEPIAIEEWDDLYMHQLPTTEESK